MFNTARLLTVTLFALCTAALPQDAANPSEPRTNAARLARGLPPLRPNFARAKILPGRTYEPIRNIVRRTDSSHVLLTTGRIKVTRTSDGSAVGYINSTYNQNGRYGVTTNPALSLIVKFAGPQPLDITALNGPDPAHPFVGAVLWTGTDFQADQQGFALIVGTSNTAPGVGASSVGNSLGYTYSESAIWYYSTLSNRLTPTWVNTNGAAAPSTLWYLPAYGDLLLVSNPIKFNSAYPGGYAVAYTLETL